MEMATLSLASFREAHVKGATLNSREFFYNEKAAVTISNSGF